MEIKPHNGKVYIDEDLYTRIKTGKLNEIVIYGYDDDIYTYELTKIERDGRIYKLETHN